MADTLRSSSQSSLLWRWMLSLLLFPLPVGATSVLSYSFPSLVQEAEVIAVGTVTAIRTAWDADTDTPYTLVTFSQLEVLKGADDQTELTLRFLGGPLPDGSVMQIAGVPHFTQGERSVIFCAGNNHQAIPLVGIWQGVYRVVFDAERGVDTIHDHAGQPVTTLPTADGEILHDSHAHDDHAHGTGQAALTAAPPDTLTLPALRHRITQELYAEED